MDISIGFLLGAFAALFAIIDPLAIVPAFITITQDMSHKARMRIIKRAMVTALGVLLVFGLMGQVIFTFLGFTIHAFRIAGGILLFVVGFTMLHGKRPTTKYTHEEHEVQRGKEGGPKDAPHKGKKGKRGKGRTDDTGVSLEQEEIGVVPIGIPLIAGPGAITTVMIYMSDATVGLVDKVIVLLILLFVLLITYLSLRYSEAIFKRVGRMGSLAISRIMGLILAAIAVQFIIDGIVGVATDLGLL